MIQILQGDCREVLPDMETGCVEIVVTSPPYNQVREWSGGGPSSMKSMKRLRARQRNWYPDNVPEHRYQNQQKQVVRECLRVARSSVFYNHKIRYAWKRRRCIYHPLDWLREFPIWCEIIWDRGGATGGNSRRFLVSDERIYQIGRPQKWNGAGGWTTVWKIPPAHVEGHPCVFPEELVRRCIRATTDPGDTVLDPYCGSGQVGRVCEQLGRSFIGIELLAEYVQVARKRCEREATEATGEHEGNRGGDAV